MNEPTQNINDDSLENLELINANIAKVKAEAEKLKAEAEEIRSKQENPWRLILTPDLIKYVVAGLLGGGVAIAFFINNLKTAWEINVKAQETITNEYKKLENSNQILNREKQELADANNTLQKDKNTLQKDKEELTKTADKLKAKTDNLEIKAKSLQDEIQRLKNSGLVKTDRQAQIIEETKKAVQETRESIQNSQKSIDSIIISLLKDFKIAIFYNKNDREAAKQAKQIEEIFKQYQNITITLRPENNVQNKWGASSNQIRYYSATETKQAEILKEKIKSSVGLDLRLQPAQDRTDQYLSIFPL